MAINTIFEGTYGERGSGGEYTLRIGTLSGDVTPIAASERRFDIYEPGLSIDWKTGREFLSPVVGSALRFTASLREAQLSKWEQLLDLPEGDVYAFVFNGDGPAFVQSDLMWFGHLLVESCIIKIEQDITHFSCEFTDGLGSLRGVEYRDQDGELYLGQNTTAYYIKEVLSKLPGVQAMAATFTGSISLFNETGFPYYEAETSNGNFYKFPVGSPVLEKTRINADTFNIPKKDSNRIRELDVPRQYFNCKDVLEDICLAFGATIALQNGRFQVVCRTTDALFEGTSGMKSNLYLWTPSTGALVSVSDSATSYNIGNITKGRYYLEGATKSRMMPYSEAVLDHEEGGSDSIYVSGLYRNTIPQLWNANTQAIDTIGGARFDRRYDYQTTAAVGEPYDYIWRKYPHNPALYTGFDPQTIDNLELTSGQELRFQFRGHMRAQTPPNAILQTISDPLQAPHVGCTAIIRARIQFTDTDGESYRLSRTVFTHMVTNGVPDYISIDSVSVWDSYLQLFNDVEREYYRKLYNELEWVHQDDPGYDDAWYELMVPHGDTVDDGDGWGSTMHALTEQYGSQVGYAPIGTEIQGDISGAGVILQGSNDDGTFLQYFKEDVRFQLPQNALDENISFESLYVEWGAEEWEWNDGPRRNDGVVGEPMWKSASYGNLDGFIKYSGSGAFVKHPEFLYFATTRICAGDGSNTSNILTRVGGGYGYESANLGGTRLGSRLTYFNYHAAGTVFGNVRDSATTWSTEYKDKLRWRPHNPEDATYGAGGSVTYDSLHAAVCTEYLQIFGESCEMISGTAISKDGSHIGPIGLFECFTTDQLDGTVSYKLLPIDMSWSLYGGCRFSALVIGKARYAGVEEYIEDKRPMKGGGRVHDKPGYGSVSVAFEGAGVQDEIDGVVGDITDIKDNILAQLELFGIFMERK